MLHAFVDGICNFNVVGSRLGNDNNTYHGHAVHFHVTLYIGCSQFGITDIAEADYLSVDFLNDYVVEFLGRVHLSHGAQGQFHGITFNAAGR